jgi:myo-inositol-1(or 4)-monophosphatase
VDPVALADLAQRLAVEAGDMVAERRRAGPVLAGTKSSPTDVVTELDHLSETMIVNGLGTARPDDTIIGEEGTARPGGTGVEWLVDPVDGTTNLLYGLPTWAVSIAARQHGETLAGVVYVPGLGVLYRAAAGHGASCNGEPLLCSGGTDLATALVATGFSYHAAQRGRQGELVARILPQVRDIRRFGSAALDLCLVAAGHLDAYFERGLNPWDLAAGELIARESGVVTTDFAGGPAVAGDVVAAPPGLHGALLGLLRSGTDA